jgi:hypothetical protein
VVEVKANLRGPACQPATCVAAGAIGSGTGDVNGGVDGGGRLCVGCLDTKLVLDYERL